MVEIAGKSWEIFGNSNCQGLILWPWDLLGNDTIYQEVTNIISTLGPKLFPLLFWYFCDKKCYHLGKSLVNLISKVIPH